MQSNNEQIITNYTKDGFLNTFNTIKDCIRFNRWTMEQNENRLENQEFIDNYNLTTEKIKKILMGIKIEDFCYATSHIKEKKCSTICVCTKSKSI